MPLYEPRLLCDATQIGRFRGAIGQAGVEDLLKASIDTAAAFRVVKPAEFERVIVDTTVQEKAIAHPVDSRLPEIGRHRVVAAAKRRCGVMPGPREHPPQPPTAIDAVAVRACERIRRARAGHQNLPDPGEKRSHSTCYGEHLLAACGRVLAA